MKPIELSNALKINRPKLGDLTGVGLYRLLRLVALEDIMGTGASAISYYAGKKLGQDLNIKTLDEFLELCKQLNIGIIEILEMTDTHMHVDIYECVTCSGMDPVGRPICHFEGGLIAGAVEIITGKSVQAKEVSCIGGLGDATCGYNLVIK
jgi:predicted hydrocarbon binding protein